MPHLRALRESDAPDIPAAFGDPGMARQGTVRDASQAQEYVRRHLADDLVAVAVCDDADALVGLVALQVDRDNLVGWFSYWMRADHRGRGRTSRAAATVAAMSSAVWAALTKPASYSAGAIYTPRSSRPWNSWLKRALSVRMTCG